MRLSRPDMEQLKARADRFAAAVTANERAVWAEYLPDALRTMEKMRGASFGAYEHLLANLRGFVVFADANPAVYKMVGKAVLNTAVERFSETGGACGTVEIYQDKTAIEHVAEKMQSVNALLFVSGDATEPENIGLAEVVASYIRDTPKAGEAIACAYFIAARENVAYKTYWRALKG